MKKYDKYYPAALAVKKKKLRKKSSFSLLKPLFLFSLLVGFCLGGYWLAKQTYQVVSASQLGVWSPETLSISGADGSLAKELQAITQEKLKAPFSVQDAVKLQHQLAQKYPQLRSIRVKRGLLTRQLKISVQHRAALAKFQLPAGDVRYIDEDGSVYENVRPDPLRQIPTVELEGAVPEHLSSDVVGLIESVFKLKNQLDYAGLHINLIDNTVEMQLSDGSEIHFGTAQSLRQKVRRAAQIEALARQAAAQPHILNFTYFDEGKVFLRQKAR